MANQQKPVQQQTMTSQQVPGQLSDDQLEQVSGGNGEPEALMKKLDDVKGMAASAKKMRKVGMLGAGLLGVGALTEGGSPSIRTRRR